MSWVEAMQTSATGVDNSGIELPGSCRDEDAAREVFDRAPVVTCLPCGVSSASGLE
jgi:hypothetical protein